MKRTLGAWLALAALMAVAAGSAGAAGGPRDDPQDRRPTRAQRETLLRYAEDTWQSFVAMTDRRTGLTADNLSAEGERAEYTSPTNIAAYLWSTITARDLGLISRREAFRRMERTLRTLETLERSDGMFFNWYDPATGEKLTTWPVNGDPVYPFLSSVDNGWLAMALMMVENAEPRLRDEAQAITDDMDFSLYYDPNAGLLRGGRWPETIRAGECHTSVTGDPADPRKGFTCHHYGALNTEPRIASYIGIAEGDIPATHYFKLWRTFPASCDWSWQEMQPEGVTRNYLGVDVFEGHYTYRGMDIVPSWGGSMFEALMVPLFVPEEQWGPRSWGVNHPLYVQAQIEHGLEEGSEHTTGYWGFSPSNNPAGGYSEYGVDAIGLNPDGYASDNPERTLVDYGFGDCRPAATPTGDGYRDRVVTPHASFLALDFDREAALANLANLERDFDVYGEYGFYDAVNVDTNPANPNSGQVSRYYLALDQGMIMAALGNELLNDRLQRYFAREIDKAIQPLLAMEEFTAGGGR
jgi:hypothetical protein